MKKLAFALFLTIITISFAFAGDAIKVLRVYSGGQCTSIPLAGVDSLDHSLYDADGKLYSQYTSSVIHAIDSDYQIPINSIDKIVVGEIDVQQFEVQINEIADFIDKQTELEVNAFQANLLAWLNANENIQEATINEIKNHITIKFKNGLEYYVNFQNTSFTDDENTESRAKARMASNNDEYTEGFYNVTSIKEEEILAKSKIMYIRGLDMALSFLNNEDKAINDELRNSPINIILEPYNRSLLFLDEPFEDYSLIIISQTHGNSVGSFAVENRDAAFERGFIKAMSVYNRGIQIYIDNKGYIIKESGKQVYWITPQLISRKLNNCNSILYGSYCWSYGLSNYCKNNSIFGYDSPSEYVEHNTTYLVAYLMSFLHGKTQEQAISPLIKNDYEEWMWYNGWFRKVHVYPKTNRLDSKQRYFSISTDDITKTAANGQPIISGKINGYENLKKNDLTYLIYFHKGDGEFSPENAKEDECMVLKIPGRNDISDFEIKEDGSFSFEFPGFLLSNTKYQMIFAFEYNDNYYFGETKFIEPEEKDNTISSGELVDLGLSVKWASCNVGAETPSQLGTKIKTDIISEAYKSNPSLFNEDGTKADFCRSGYDLAYKQSAGRMRMPTYQELKELKEKCQWELSVVDGVAGARIVGPNKNSIFLPADTEKTEQPYFGDSYMLNRTVYTSGTYDKNEISWSWDLASILIYGMYMPQLSMSSFLNIEFGNDFEAYIRPVGN